jgi:hypothetical protein
MPADRANATLSEARTGGKASAFAIDTGAEAVRSNDLTTSTGLKTAPTPVAVRLSAFPSALIIRLVENRDLDTPVDGASCGCCVR